jgi:DNA primase large subunit
MDPLTRQDLLTLEQYAEQRDGFRARVLEHKKHRRVDIGPHLTLYFEDRLTVQYQVQEMLRIERIFEADGIEEELSAYNPLIPDGSNLKCTAMFEFEDVAERRRRLAELVGVENQVWMQVEGFDKVYAIANEDLERSTDEKTSAVHFMRFEFTPEMIGALHAGERLRAGVNSDLYRHETGITGDTRSALVGDLSVR